jgi:antitoxin MazE
MNPYCRRYAERQRLDTSAVSPLGLIARRKLNRTDGLRHAQGHTLDLTLAKYGGHVKVFAYQCILDIHCAHSVYPRENAVQVSKWGNSLAVRLPANLVQALKLKAGDRIRIAAQNNNSAHTELVIAREPTRAEILQGLRKHRRPLPARFKFDRELANARG